MTSRTRSRDKIRYRLWGLPRRPAELDAAVLMLGTLRRIGWTRSIAEGLPVDRDGRAMPWWTYPAIEWVDAILRGDERVVEFGSGNSTRWLSERAARVTSIEHDLAWAERARRRSAGNVDVRHVVCAGDLVSAPGDDPYPAVLSEIPNGDADVIVIDGLARVDCLRLAVPHLEAGALVLLDDADRAELAAGIDLVQAAGAVRLDLVGPVPGGTNFGCTSVFVGPDRAFPTPHRLPRPWGLEIPDFWRA